MPPDTVGVLEDIRDAAQYIVDDTAGMTFVEFERDRRTRQLVERNFELIAQVHETGVSVLVVEQNANLSLAIADRGYVLQTGRIVLADRAGSLLANDDLKKAYLGR